MGGWVDRYMHGEVHWQLNGSIHSWVHRCLLVCDVIVLAVQTRLLIMVTKDSRAERQEPEKKETEMPESWLCNALLTDVLKASK